MEKLGLDLDDGSSPADQKQANPQEARKLAMQGCIQSLVHACQCRDANCGLPSCPKMKRVVQHTKICKRKANGGCPICKQLTALCCIHAKYCQETKCPVPFCQNIKYKMKQEKLQARLQQAQLLRRRMAVMNTGGSAAVMGTTAVSPGTPQAVVMPPLPTPGPPHQPGIGLKPGTQTPPANVLQIPASGIWPAAEADNPPVLQGAQGPLVGGLRQPQPVPNPAVDTQDLEQLFHGTLRSPNSQKQQQRILQILKSNPKLMAAFLKGQLSQAMQQQQQQQ